MNSAGSDFAILRASGSSNVTYLRSFSERCASNVVFPTCRGPVTNKTGKVFEILIIVFSIERCIYTGQTLSAKLKCNFSMTSHKHFVKQIKKPQGFTPCGPTKKLLSGIEPETSSLPRTRSTYWAIAAKIRLTLILTYIWIDSQSEPPLNKFVCLDYEGAAASDYAPRAAAPTGSGFTFTCGLPAVARCRRRSCQSCP